MGSPGTGSPSVEQLKRGDVWFAKLGQSHGAEMWRLTPCIVLQANYINRSSVFETVVIVPCSSRIIPPEKRTKFDVVLSSNDTGLPTDVTVLWSLVTAISPKRLQNKTGRISQESLKSITQHISLLIEGDDI